MLYRLYEIQHDHAQAGATRWESGPLSPEPTEAGLPKETGSGDLDSLIHRLARDHGSSKQIKMGDAGIEPVVPAVPRSFRSRAGSLVLRDRGPAAIDGVRSHRIGSVRQRPGRRPAFFERFRP